MFFLVVKVKPSDKENLGTMVELWFTFSLIWSICASVDENGRQRMDAFLREKDGTFPVKVVCRLFHVLVHVEEFGRGGGLDAADVQPSTNSSRTPFMSTTWTARRRRGWRWKTGCPRDGATTPSGYFMVSLKRRRHLCFCEGSGCSDEISTVIRRLVRTQHGLPVLHCWLAFDANVLTVHFLDVSSSLLLLYLPVQEVKGV